MSFLHAMFGGKAAAKLAADDHMFAGKLNGLEIPHGPEGQAKLVEIAQSHTKGDPVILSDGSASTWGSQASNDDFAIMSLKVGNPTLTDADAHAAMADIKAANMIVQPKPDWAAINAIKAAQNAKLQPTATVAAATAAA